MDPSKMQRLSLIHICSVLLMFGASEKTIVYAWAYMEIYACGTIFVQLALGLNAFINAQGYAKIGMMTVAIGAVCNIILDPIFIFALNMGVRGAAWATIISQAVSCIWILKFLTGKKSLLKIKLQTVSYTHLPCLYGSWPGSVGAQDYRFVHNSPQHCVAQFPSDSAGLDTGDCAVLHVIDN